MSSEPKKKRGMAFNGYVPQATCMTREQYFDPDGNNGNPVNWRPKHVHLGRSRADEGEPIVRSEVLS